MSISKRLVDLAKANLNALLDKAAVTDSPLAGLSDEELEAELDRRRQRRLREADEVRAREAAERAARQRAAERAAQQAQRRMGDVEAELKRMKERAGTSGPPPRQAPKRPSSSSNGQQKRTPPPRPSAGMSEKRLRDLYQQLETPYGAPFEEVKKSFRRLMRKYHPDLHVGNPVKHKTATQLTMSLTQAYNELEQHLVGGRAK